MWKKIVLGVFVIGILCAGAGFAVLAAQTNFDASRNTTRHVALTGDEGGSGMPFCCEPLGDEGGPVTPFVNGTN